MITLLKNVGKLPNTLHSCEILRVNRGQTPPKVKWTFAQWPGGRREREERMGKLAFSQRWMGVAVAPAPRKGRPPEDLPRLLSRGHWVRAKYLEPSWFAGTGKTSCAFWPCDGLLLKKRSSTAVPCSFPCNWVWVWVWVWCTLQPQLGHLWFCCPREFCTFRQKESPRSSADASIEEPCPSFCNTSSNGKLTDLTAWG